VECTGDTKVVVIAECGALRVDTALDEGKTARSGFEALEDVWDEYMRVSQSVKGLRVMIAHQWRPRATSARFLLCMVAWLLDYCDEGPLMFRAGVSFKQEQAVPLADGAFSAAFNILSLKIDLLRVHTRPCAIGAPHSSKPIAYRALLIVSYACQARLARSII